MRHDGKGKPPGSAACFNGVNPPESMRHDGLKSGENYNLMRFNGVNPPESMRQHLSQSDATQLLRQTFADPGQKVNFQAFVHPLTISTFST